MTDTTAVPFTHALNLALSNDLMEQIERTYQKSKDCEVFFLTRGDMLRHALSTGLTYISNHLEEWHEDYLCNEDASFTTLKAVEPSKMEQQPKDKIEGIKQELMKVINKAVSEETFSNFDDDVPF